MTVQHHDTSDAEPRGLDQTDPVGPITLPRRSRIGARAMALVGSPIAVAGLVAVITEGPGTFPTISVY